MVGLYDYWSLIPRPLETTILRVIQHQKIEQLYSGSMDNPVDARKLVTDWWAIEETLR